MAGVVEHASWESCAKDLGEVGINVYVIPEICRGIFPDGHGRHVMVVRSG